MIIADHWHDGPAAWFAIVPILALLFWGTVIFLLARGWRRGWWGPRGPQANNGARSPHALLAERYARGEISEQEYRERRTVLMETEK